MGRRSDLFQAFWLFEYVHYLQTGVHLFVVGDGPSRMELEHAVQGLGIEGTNICFLGARPDVPALMGLAELALVVKPKGGMNVVLEAMAAGLAVVGSDTPDFRSIIQSNDTGVLFPAAETREGSRAVRNLLLDVARRRRIGQSARNWVRERHSVASVLSTYELLYGQ
jgi:glycosyltransferase involved in cell wall biosynthesis